MTDFFLKSHWFSFFYIQETRQLMEKVLWFIIEAYIQINIAETFSIWQIYLWHIKWHISQFLGLLESFYLHFCLILCENLKSSLEHQSGFILRVICISDVATFKYTQVVWFLLYGKDLRLLLCSTSTRYPTKSFMVHMFYRLEYNLIIEMWNGCMELII